MSTNKHKSKIGKLKRKVRGRHRYRYRLTDEDYYMKPVSFDLNKLNSKNQTNNEEEEEEETESEASTASYHSVGSNKEQTTTKGNVKTLSVQDQKYNENGFQVPYEYNIKPFNPSGRGADEEKKDNKDSLKDKTNTLTTKGKAEEEEEEEEIEKLEDSDSGSNANDNDIDDDVEFSSKPIKVPKAGDVTTYSFDYPDDPRVTVKEMKNFYNKLLSNENLTNVEEFSVFDDNLPGKAPKLSRKVNKEQNYSVDLLLTAYEKAESIGNPFGADPTKSSLLKYALMIRYGISPESLLSLRYEYNTTKDIHGNLKYKAKYNSLHNYIVSQKL